MDTLSLSERIAFHTSRRSLFEDKSSSSTAQRLDIIHPPHHHHHHQRKPRRHNVTVCPLVSQVIQVTKKFRERPKQSIQKSREKELERKSNKCFFDCQSSTLSRDSSSRTNKRANYSSVKIAGRGKEEEEAEEENQRRRCCLSLIFGTSTTIDTRVSHIMQLFGWTLHSCWMLLTVISVCCCVDIGSSSGKNQTTASITTFWLCCLSSFS